MFELIKYYLGYPPIYCSYKKCGKLIKYGTSKIIHYCSISCRDNGISSIINSN